MALVNELLTYIELKHPVADEDSSFKSPAVDIENDVGAFQGLPSGEKRTTSSRSTI